MPARLALPKMLPPHGYATFMPRANRVTRRICLSSIWAQCRKGERSAIIVNTLSGGGPLSEPTCRFARRTGAVMLRIPRSPDALALSIDRLWDGTTRSGFHWLPLKHKNQTLGSFRVHWIPWVLAAIPQPELIAIGVNKWGCLRCPQCADRQLSQPSRATFAATSVLRFGRSGWQGSRHGEFSSLLPSCCALQGSRGGCPSVAGHSL